MNKPAGPGAVVRRFRRRAGLTQQELADLAGLSVAALRDMEQGRVVAPRAGTLRRLGEVLSLSREELSDLLGAGDDARSGARSGLWVEVLGPLQVFVDGAPVDLGSRTQQLLLAALALTPNEPVSRDALVELLWDGRPPDGVVGLLQSRVSRLRRRLVRSTASGPASASGPVASTSAGYRLLVSDGEHDVLAFSELVAKARRLAATGGLEPARDAYAAAVALWRGTPLAGLDELAAHPAVVRVSREWRQTVIEYGTVASELGRHDEVVTLLQEVVDADPMHEAAHAALMIALAGSGQQAAALTVYDRLRHRLADELGADPSPELSAAYQRVLRQDVARSEFAPVAAHRQLPPDIAEFTGRMAELRALHDTVPDPAEGSTAIVVSAIEGMAGVGKTRLAVRFAHELVQAGRYTDEQLYVDLHGHAENPPADPAAVLASFLRLLGVPGDQIPPDLNSRAAMYRDRIVDKNVLVVLDNAVSEAQIRPLLPAGPTNLVLITSRRALAMDGAHILRLDVFPPQDAHSLLTQILGHERVAAEPHAARRVAELCGHLPLAVALAARRLQTRPSWRFADLAARLEEAANRLSQLSVGSRRLRSVFDLSYQALNPEQQRTFRLLGLHPGDDFTVCSAAALIGSDPDTTRELLDSLVDEHLFNMLTAERYRHHDIVREYARQVVETDEPPAAARAAIGRVLDYYLHTTYHATELRQPSRLGMDLAGKPPAYRPDIQTEVQANEWLEAERACLTAAVGMAAENGLPTHAWQLAESLRWFLYQHGYVEDWVQCHETALAGAIAAGDLAGEALMRLDLGGAYLSQGRSDEARHHLKRAYELHRQRGDVVLEVYTLNALGVLAGRQGRFREALTHVQHAIDRWSGNDEYPAGLLRNNLGFVLIKLGRYDEALAALHEAVTLSRAARNNDNTSTALSNIGDAYRHLGRYAPAVECLTEALELARAASPKHGVAFAHHRLGNTYRAMGRLEQAIDELVEALRIARTAAGGLVSESECLIDLAAVRGDLGDLEAASELLGDALELAVKRSEVYHQARAHCSLAAMFSRLGQTELSDEHTRRAGALFDSLGVARPIPAE